MNTQRKKYHPTGIQNKGGSSGYKDDKEGDWLAHSHAQEIVLAMFSPKVTTELQGG